MKIIKDYPPNYKEICKVFNIADRKTIVFTYGNILYVPKGNGKITPDIKVHEKTHEVQQAGNPEAWWSKYLTDKKFRLSQELEAYRNQYQFFIKFNHNLKDHAKLLDKIAKDISSEIYGNIITNSKAKDSISIK